MKMKILIGTLHFEAGTFQKDDIVEVSAERFATFDMSQVEAVPEEPAPIIEAPVAWTVSDTTVIEEKPLAKTRKRSSVVSDA
jgi:hypothetical protein